MVKHLDFLFMILVILIRVLPFVVTAISEFMARRDEKLNGFNAAGSAGASHGQNLKYESFQVGRFRGTLRRRLMAEAQKSAQIDLRNDIGELQIMTYFSLVIPEVRSFGFKVEFPKSRWVEKWRLSDSEFLGRLSWEISERELDEALHRPEAIELLRDLFSLGPGSVVCSDNDFSIYIRRAITSEAQLDLFLSTAKKIFRLYARVVQLNVLTWRSPENNYDWWNVRDQSFV